MAGISIGNDVLRHEDVSLIFANSENSERSKGSKSAQMSDIADAVPQLSSHSLIQPHFHEACFLVPVLHKACTANCS